MEKESIDYKELYKLAIEERRNHQANYNHWMNMYSIFTGALFVALYEIIMNSCTYKNLFLFFLTSLGTICSWCWFCSCKGWYRWMISWISIVSWYEVKIKDSSNNDVYLYRLFADPKKKSKNNYKFPFSTPKLTQVFVLFVAILWSVCFVVILINGIYPNFLKTMVEIKFFNVAIYILGFVFTLTFLILAIKKRENLSSSHKRLGLPQEDENTLISEKMEITVFE